MIDSNIKNFFKHYFYQIAWSILFTITLLAFTAAIFIASYKVLIYVLASIIAISEVAAITINTASIFISAIASLEFGLWLSFNISNLPILLHSNKTSAEQQEEKDFARLIKDIDTLIIEIKSSTDIEKRNLLLIKMETKILDFVKNNTLDQIGKHFVYLVNNKVFIDKIREFRDKSSIVKQLFIDHKPHILHETYVLGRPARELLKNIKKFSEKDQDTEMKELFHVITKSLQESLREYEIFYTTAQTLTSHSKEVQENTVIVHEVTRLGNYSATMKQISAELNRLLNQFTENPIKENYDSVKDELTQFTPILEQFLKDMYPSSITVPTAFTQSTSSQIMNNKKQVFI